MTVARLERALHRAARRDYLRDYYARNKDKIAALKRDYYARNKDKIAALNRDYYARNKDKIAALKRDYKVRRVLRELARDPPQPKDVRELERRTVYEQKLVRVGRGWGARCSTAS